MSRSSKQGLTPGEELEKVNRQLEKYPDEVTLLYRRASLLQQLERYGEALNDLHRILEIQPDHREARERAHFLATILKFTNIDIFSDPNTHHDPWME